VRAALVSSENSPMETIGAAGLRAIQDAQARLLEAGRRIASGAVEPEDVVELRVAEREERAGALLLRVSDRLKESLLDVLA
jgi:hypothetical protein